MVLFRPTEPARITSTEPSRRSKAAVEVSTPVDPVMTPLWSETVATVSLKVPKARVPPARVTLPASARTLLAPRTRVPTLTVVPPVKVLAPESVSVPAPILVRPPEVLPPLKATAPNVACVVYSEALSAKASVNVSAFR